MRSFSFFLVFSLIAGNAYAQNFFTGDYSADDIREEKPVSSQASSVKSDTFEQNNVSTYQKQSVGESSAVSSETETKSAVFLMDNHEKEVVSEDTDHVYDDKSNPKKNNVAKSDPVADEDSKTKERERKNADRTFSGYVPEMPVKKEGGISAELDALAPISLDDTAYDENEVISPKAVNLPKSNISSDERKAQFFMNDKGVPQSEKISEEEASNMNNEPVERMKGIFISYIPNKTRVLLGGLRECVFGLEVENLSGKLLKRMRAKFLWRNPVPDPDTGEYRERQKVLNLVNLADKEKKPMYMRQPGKTLCNDYSSVKFPRVKIESCIIEGMSEMQCANMIRLRR